MPAPLRLYDKSILESAGKLNTNGTAKNDIFSVVNAFLPPHLLTLTASHNPLCRIHLAPPHGYSLEEWNWVWLSFYVVGNVLAASSCNIILMIDFMNMLFFMYILYFIFGGEIPHTLLGRLIKPAATYVGI